MPERTGPGHRRMVEAHPATWGDLVSRATTEQLALETICCIDGKVTLPPTVGDRLTYEGGSEVIRVRIADGAFSRCHRHAFNLPNIFLCEIRVVEDEAA